MFLGHSLLGQIIYTVNTTDDVDDGVCDGVHCSLREAINVNNNDNIPSNIHFNISGNAPFIISPNTNLPDIADDYTIIDATTQPNWYLGSIILDGINTNEGTGLRGNYLAEYSEYYGLQFTNWQIGLVLSSSFNKVGSVNRQNIFGNSTAGLYVSGFGHIIKNNYMGTNIDNDDLRNDWGGGILLEGGHYCTIKNNVIAFNERGIFNRLSSTNQNAIYSNTYFCNDTPIYSEDVTYIPSPIFDSISINTISGISQVLNTIEVYISNGENCTQVPPCQAVTLIGSVQADSTGKWELTNLNLNEDDRILAVAIDTRLVVGIENANNRDQIEVYPRNEVNNTSLFTECIRVGDCINSDLEVNVAFDSTLYVDSTNLILGFTNKNVQDSIILDWRILGGSGQISLIEKQDNSSIIKGNYQRGEHFVHMAYIATDTIGCSAVEQLSVKVIEHPCIYSSITTSINIGVKALFESESKVFSSLTKGGTNEYTDFEWRKIEGTGDIQIINHQNGTATLNGINTGEVELELKVTDSQGCSASARERIYVISNNYVVNVTDNLNDGVCDDNHCSLEEALNVAAIDNEPSLISFNINGVGPHIISPTKTLSFISDNDIVDGETQLINHPTEGRVTINADSLYNENNEAFIFSLTGNNTTVKGLNFVGVDNPQGVFFLSGNNNLIERNHFDSSNWNSIVLEEQFTIPTDRIYTIKENNFSGNNRVLLSPDNNNPQKNRVHFTQNNLLCNQAHISHQYLPYDHRPTVTEYSDRTVRGTSNPFEVIEVFVSDRSSCGNASHCHGEIFLGSVISDIRGYWVLTEIEEITNGNYITATATDSTGLTSDFAECFKLLPHDCFLAEPMPINNQPCSTVGTVLDLKQINSSTNVNSTSSCANTFKGNDAWFTVTVPSTGNFLIRTNLNNTVVPVIEAYTEDCENLVLVQCDQLDSIPFTMVFENYTPNSQLFLRVWDKDNTLVDSDNTALLHITAHELSLNKDDWGVCDFENNLINGNPTILSERDANSFILEFDSTATPTEIDEIQQTLEQEGASLSEECLCNSVPLQLWKSGNPIDMEDRRTRIRRRAKVDTTNYNYIFETVEFQVNAYAIGQQYGTDVAMDAEGNFVMTWIDEQRGHNYGRVYKSSGNPITQEFQIGASDKRQFATDVEMMANGEFIVVWHENELTNPDSSKAIFGRKYSAEGIPKGVSFNISKAASEKSDSLNRNPEFGENPNVSVDNNGNFVVVWHVLDSVYMQQYRSDTLYENIKKLDLSISNSISPSPHISVSPNGDLVVTWVGYDNDETGIFCQLYDENGDDRGDAFLVNSFDSRNQTNPTTDITVDGSFIVAWESYEEEGVGKDYGIFAQRFDANGNKIGTPFQVNSYTDDAQRHPSVALFNDGSFVISWSSRGQDGHEEGIYAKFYDANGNEISPPFDDSERGSIGNEFRLNTYEEPEQDKPSTATNGTNIMITAWEDGANDGSFEGIFAQRYEFIDGENTKIFYPIGTATPSTLLGDKLDFPPSIYEPNNAVKRAKVAVIDTGIDEDHPHLLNALWLNPAEIDDENCVLEDVIGYDFVNESGIPNDVDGHGTKVNGILTRDFDTGVQLELMNLKFHELNRGKVFDAICAIYYAVDNGADILNLSWGFEASEFPSILYKALKYASDNDVLIVTTAGNTSKNNDRINKFPANFDLPNILVVTSYEYRAANGQIKLANYASYGEITVDIAAYGFMETPIKGGDLEASAGTSLAAPLVARTAAIIKGLYPVLTATEIKDCILSSAASETALTNLVLTSGILNHDGALECARLKEEMIINSACENSDLTISTTKTPETCNGYDGSIQLSINGGVGQPSISWSTNTEGMQLTNLNAGVYGVSVTDEMRCFQTSEILVSKECGSTYCHPNQFINGNPIPTNQYRSSDILESAGFVEKDSVVTFMAVQSITLKAGFTAEKGAKFIARIEDCPDNLLVESATARDGTMINNSIVKTKVYPNPSSQLLHIEVDKATTGFNLVIYDLMGRELGHKKVKQNSTSISVNTFATGIYYLSIDGIKTEKIVVVNQ